MVVVVVGMVVVVVGMVVVVVGMVVVGGGGVKVRSTDHQVENRKKFNLPDGAPVSQG